MSDLSEGAVLAVLARLGAPVGRPLSVVAETGSTNDDARLAAAQGAPHGAAFLADAQTKGRGRGGHTWHSPPGENLYLSMIARPSVPAASIAPVALAVGVAVARVVEAMGVPVWIKWPNDVLAGERRAGEPAIHAAKKLAGILVEGQLRGMEVASVIVGAGLNVHARSFPEEIARRATSLAMLGVMDRDRSAIAAALLAGIGAAITSFEQDRLASFTADLDRLDALRGARVEVSGVRGIAEGIDAEGMLLVRGADGSRNRVGTGEVRLVDR